MEWLRLIGARLSIGLLSTVVILTFWVIHLHHLRQVEMRRAMEYASGVSSMLEDVLSTLKDAEIGERGYLITGRSDYLEPYLSARGQLSELMARLKHQVAGNFKQERQLRTIKPLVAARLDEMQEAVDARRERGFEAAAAIIVANGDKATMPAIRARIAEAEREISAHLQEHMEPALSLGGMLGTAVLSGVISFGLTSAGFQLGRRKDALEEAIRKNEALLSTVLSQMPSGVAIADVSGRLLLGNRQMERIWRHPFRPADGVMDYRVYQGFHADGRPYQPQEWPLARSLGKGETIESEVVYFLRGDHTCGAMEISSAPIRDRGGRIIAGVATFHDVTDRCEADRRLRDSEEQLRLALDAGGFAVWSFDPATGMSWWSENLLNLHGLPSGRNQWRAGEIREWIHPDDRERVDAEFAAVLETGRPLATEFRISPAGGEEQWVACYGKMLEEATGKPARVIGLTQDIGLRKRMEEDLRRSRRAFKSLVEHLPDIVFRLDRELRYLYISPTVERYLGIAPEAFPGKTAREMGFDPENCHRFETLCHRVLASGEELEFEFTDHGRYHRCRLVAESGPNGAVECILGIIENITAQKLAEGALRRSEERLRLAQRAANAGVWDWDMVTGHLYWSDEACQLFGLEPGAMDLTGNRWLAAVHPDDRERVTAAIMAALNGRQEFFQMDYRILRPDGSVRWLEDRGQLFYAADGRPTRMLGINIDITDRKQAEEATRRQANLLEETHDAILVRKLGGTILYWNRGAEVLYGYPGSEAAGANSYTLFRIECPESMALLETHLRKQGRWEGELVHTTRDGRKLMVESRQLLFKEADGGLLVLETNRDITERKLAEQALQEANRRKDEFLAMLAHELRNPLAPIRNAIEVLRRTGPPEPNQRWAREVLERQVAQLTRLVDDLLDVSRITRGKIGLRKEIVDLGEIVEQAVEISNPLIHSRRHTLSVAPVPGSVRIEGDRARLIQVISNLLNNAAKYTPEGGLIQVEIEAGPQEATVRVRDNGTGISAELLPHIFEPFRQADETLARSQGGLGVGLTLVQRLAELHGGRAEARSGGIGQGSEFTVVLPRVENRAV
jgi:PAS domain S-box-containing protein